MLNHIVIMGRIVKDPELRFTQSNTPVASFTVAVDRDFGEDKQTDFIGCTAWRKTGEFVSKHFQKGSMIVVSGRLQSRKWEDKDGNKRTSWEINAENVYFGGDKKSENNADYYNGKGVNARADTFEDLPDDVGGSLPF